MHRSISEFLDHYVPEVTGVRPPSIELEALAGDASDRRYYRVSLSGSKEEASPSLILMEILNLESSLRSEEVTLYHDVSGELPFLNIHRFLASLQVPVPAIHVYDAKQGLMLLEDFGPTLMWDAVSDAETVYLSVFVLGELYAGFRGGKRETENRRWLREFMQKSSVYLLPAAEQTAEVFGDLHHKLKSAGTPIPVNDLWIAAQAVEAGAFVVSYDEHFARIPGLLLWPSLSCD